MSDIVERLRTRQVTNWVHATGQTPRASGKRTDPLCAAAADEIERLRAEAAGLRERVRVLEGALDEVLAFQSAPKQPTIHDWGRWRRIRAALEKP